MIKDVSFGSLASAAVALRTTTAVALLILFATSHNAASAETNQTGAVETMELDGTLR